jgi:hypothetical protein
MIVMLEYADLPPVAPPLVSPTDINNDLKNTHLACPFYIARHRIHQPRNPPTDFVIVDLQILAEHSAFYFFAGRGELKQIAPGSRTDTWSHVAFSHVIRQTTWTLTSSNSFANVALEQSTIRRSDRLSFINK